MYQRIKTIEVATKNYRVAMEPETILKNGVQLKNHISRGNNKLMEE